MQKRGVSAVVIDAMVVAFGGAMALLVALSLLRSGPASFITSIFSAAFAFPLIAMFSLAGVALSEAWPLRSRALVLARSLAIGALFGVVGFILAANLLRFPTPVFVYVAVGVFCGLIAGVNAPVRP